MTSPPPSARSISDITASIRQLYLGGSNNTGRVTLTPNATTTVVPHQACNLNSHISIMPITESALKALIATPVIYPLSRVLSAAPGNVGYTGLGFKPTLLQFNTGMIGGSTSYGSTGSADASLANQSCLEWNGAGTGGCFFQPNTAGILRDATGANYQSYSVASMDADGFTLSWSKTGTPPTVTFNVSALCWPETGVRVSSRSTGSFTLTHSKNAAVDQTFTYSITGGA
jgi:hypothetical protein